MGPRRRRRPIAGALPTDDDIEPAEVDVGEYL